MAMGPLSAHELERKNEPPAPCHGIAGAWGTVATTEPVKGKAGAAYVPPSERSMHSTGGALPTAEAAGLGSEGWGGVGSAARAAPAQPILVDEHVGSGDIFVDPGVLDRHQAATAAIREVPGEDVAHDRAGAAGCIALHCVVDAGSPSGVAVLEVHLGRHAGADDHGHAAAVER